MTDDVRDPELGNHVRDRVIAESLCWLLGAGRGICICVPFDKDNQDGYHGNYLVHIESLSGEGGQLQVTSTELNLPMGYELEVFVNDHEIKWAVTNTVIPSPSIPLPPNIKVCLPRKELDVPTGSMIIEMTLSTLFKEGHEYKLDLWEDDHYPDTLLGIYEIIKHHNGSLVVIDPNGCEVIKRTQLN